MPDKSMTVVKSNSPHYMAMINGSSTLSTHCHILASVSHKAKRISSSTSHAETISANMGKELAQLIAIRLTEVFGIGIQLPLQHKPTVAQLIAIQERAEWCIPIDHYTDCRDLFELTVGERGVPQDRYQRLYIMSIREDRIKRAIRYFIWIPTSAMLADALTKSMISRIMYDLLTHGYWNAYCTGPKGNEQQPLVAPPLQTTTYTEHDLRDIKTMPTTTIHFNSTNINNCSSILMVNKSKNYNPAMAAASSRKEFQEVKEEPASTRTAITRHVKTEVKTERLTGVYTSPTLHRVWSEDWPIAGHRVWRGILQRFYRLETDKTDQEAEEIIERHQGREPELYAALLDKYMEEPNLKNLTPQASKAGPNQYLPKNACRVCGNPGHWGNEGPDKEETGNDPADKKRDNDSDDEDEPKRKKTRRGKRGGRKYW